MAQQKRIRLGTMRLQVRPLASLSTLRIWCVAMSCGVGHRRSLDLALLWLWRKSAATAQIGPLARELPCAVGAPQKTKDKKKKEFLKRREKLWS